MNPKELLYRLNREFKNYEPFKITVEVRPQESKHVAIWLYMTTDQCDELINCLENSGEVSIELLDALSESIRKKDLRLQKDIPVWEDDLLNRWKI